MTAEQLFQDPGLGRCELLRGEIVNMWPGFQIAVRNIFPA
jgi:hypothetical protein